MKSTLRQLSRRVFIQSSGAAVIGAVWPQGGPLPAPKSIETAVLNIAYVESGNPAGFPIIMLHGFPDDVHAWDDVTPPLVKAGYRVLVPYLRGFGPTRFRDSKRPRMAEQAAIGQDVADFADALKLQRFALAGFDWGGRAACITAALHEDRVRGAVLIGGYSIQNTITAAPPAAPAAERGIWYQYYFNTERGRAGLQMNRRALCRYLWETWSPTWHFTDETFDRTASAFDNPDFVDVVIHSYRHRIGNAPGEPRFQEMERRLADRPKVNVPVITLYGADDGIARPAADNPNEKNQFPKLLARRVVAGAGAFPSSRKTGSSSGGRSGDFALKRLCCFPIVLVFLTGTVFAQPLPNVRGAVDRALPLLQRSAATFVEKRACVSCHHNILPIFTFNLAQSRGFEIDAKVLQAVEDKTFRQLLAANALDDAIQATTLNDPTPNDSTLLMAAHDAGLPPSLTTAVYALRLARWQRDGHWVSSDFRPPHSSSRFTATATAVRAIQFYLPAELRVERDTVLRDARRWLFETRPSSTEDAAYRIMGLVWAEASADQIASARRDLLAMQKANGGWSQIASYEPDAYSTGEALFALYESGFSAADSSSAKGLNFLISTQAKDGSWRVKTRMLSPAEVSPKYFSTGFPYVKDEFLSYAASCWAVMALLRAIPESGTKTAVRGAQAR
jgi:pimeloyl-ACP methyl ester carboxylesterase